MIYHDNILVSDEFTKDDKNIYIYRSEFAMKLYIWELLDLPGILCLYTQHVHKCKRICLHK